MRIPYRAGVTLLALAAIPLAALPAQEQSVNELLANVNTLLRDHPYSDDNGQATVTQVKLPGEGKLMVEITKAQGAMKITNVYEVLLADISASRLNARGHGEYTSISLGARGPITGRLRCVTGATVNEWPLPEPKEIAVEFKDDGQAEHEISAALAELITAAQQHAHVSAG